jgi:hypothetical protein
LTADLRVLVKGCSETSLFPSASETDGFSRHLFLTHPHTTPTQDTVFILLTEALLVDSVGGRQILDCFGLRTGSEKKLQDHLACLHDPCRGRTNPKTFFDRISARGNEFCPVSFTDFYDTQATGTVRIEPVHVTESGDGKSEKPCRLENRHPFFHRDL